MIYVTDTIIPAGTICVLFALITSAVLGFVGVSDAQEVTGYVIQTFDDLCTEAFLNNFAKSHTIIDKLADTSGDIKSIVIHLPSDTSDSMLSALLERAEIYSVREFSVSEDSTSISDVQIHNSAQKHPYVKSKCYTELDSTLNDIVRNVMGVLDHNSRPAPFDHINTDDLIGVVISTQEPLYVQSYLEENGAVLLSTTDFDEYSNIEAFTPLSLLINLAELQYYTDISAMLVHGHTVIHTGDWYYGHGERRVWRGDVEPPGYRTVYGGNVGVIDMSTDHIQMMKELSADMQNRCHYIDGANLLAHMQCNENISAKVAEILTNTDTRAKLYVVDTNLPDTSSTANWMFEKGVDVIYIITDTKTLTVTMSRAYLLSETGQQTSYTWVAPIARLPDLFSEEEQHQSTNIPVLNLTDAIMISQGQEARYQFFANDYDINDSLTYAAASSNRSIITTAMGTYGYLMYTPSGYEEFVRGAHIKIVPHSVGTTKVTISISDGTNVVTDTVSVTVTNNTVPELNVDRARYSLIVGETHTVTPLAVDIDQDTLLYDILEPADGFTSVSIDITNDTMTLTPIAEGQDYVEMTVSDGKGGYDHGYFRVCTVVSNSPPRLSSIPEHIPISIEAETVNMSITATDTDNDKIFWFSVLSSNRSVASAQYDYAPRSLGVGQYHHVSPCELRYDGERSQSLLITPNGIGSSTLTIEIADIWGGTDTKVLHVTVYGPTDVN